ncbi:MAG: hypothetical protein ACHREM_14665 [Polyangiales bacterium]
MRPSRSLVTSLVACAIFASACASTPDADLSWPRSAKHKSADVEYEDDPYLVHFGRAPEVAGAHFVRRTQFREHLVYQFKQRGLPPRAQTLDLRGWTTVRHTLELRGKRLIDDVTIAEDVTQVLRGSGAATSEGPLTGKTFLVDLERESVTTADRKRITEDDRKALSKFLPAATLDEKPKRDDDEDDEPARERPLRLDEAPQRVGDRCPPLEHELRKWLSNGSTSSVEAKLTDVKLVDGVESAIFAVSVIGDIPLGEVFAHVEIKGTSTIRVVDSRETQRSTHAVLEADLSGTPSAAKGLVSVLGETDTTEYVTQL